MTVYLHEEDIPADLFAAGADIAVDTETMGLITPRDRLCWRTPSPPPPNRERRLRR